MDEVSVLGGDCRHAVRRAVGEELAAAGGGVAEEARGLGLL